MYAEAAGASPIALQWILIASRCIGPPYPPLDSNGEIIVTPGTLHCAQLIRAVVKSYFEDINKEVNIGSSCAKQKDYFMDYPDSWEYNIVYENSQFGLDDLRPGDFIYWTKSNNVEDDPTHVGLYVGNGYMIDSTISGGGVAYRLVKDFQKTPENSIYKFYAYARYIGS